MGQERIDLGRGARATATEIAAYEKMAPVTRGYNGVQMSDDKNVGADSLTQEAARANEELVAAIVGGDREAEHTFAVRYLRPVRAMLLARTRNADVAADLVQDVMIEAICGLRRGQLREPAKLAGFVIAIARNMVNGHFRGQMRRPEQLELPDNLPDLQSSAERLEGQEREALALMAISSLESVDKSILQMTLIDGLKPGAIAQRLRLDPNVVRQRKLRATRRVIDFVRRRSQNDSADYLIPGQRT
jgi:RNA polymerase sigma-70 factor (ECF subfamily)